MAIMQPHALSIAITQPHMPSIANPSIAITQPQTPSIANTQRVGSDIATQDIDLEVRSVDGEELGCEPSRADSDRQKATAGPP